MANWLWFHVSTSYIYFHCGPNSKQSAEGIHGCPLRFPSPGLVRERPVPVTSIGKKR